MSVISVIVLQTGDCPSCDGCGWVDNVSGVPWKYWLDLPRASTMAIDLGLIEPIQCPSCQGSGAAPPAADRGPP